MNKPALLRTLAALVLAAAVGQALQAQELTPRDEAWVLYERGKARQQDPANPEPGEALHFYLQAIEEAGRFPEAEMAIAEIYFSEGAFALAEEQFKKALEGSAAFEIPEHKYLVRYRLADLYELQGDYGDMQAQLEAIVREHSQYAEGSSSRLTDVIVDTYLSRGVDQVFTLYRMNDSSFAAAAHARLGWLTYRGGRFSQSIIHSLFALDIVISESVKEIRRTVPGFAYTSLGEFVRTASTRPPVRKYLLESSFAEILYYLATATHADGRSARAREIWNAVAGFDPELAGRYAELSQRQLRAPWVDPYLNPSPRVIQYPALP